MSSSEAAGRGARPDKSPVRRRRTYGEDEKQRLVAESFEPGASVSGIAQRHGMNANLLFTWRRQMRLAPTAEPAMELIPVEIVGAAESFARHGSGAPGTAWRHRDRAGWRRPRSG